MDWPALKRGWEWSRCWALVRRGREGRRKRGKRDLETGRQQGHSFELPKVEHGQVQTHNTVFQDNSLTRAI